MFRRIIAVAIICFMPVTFTGCASSGNAPAVAEPEPLKAESQVVVPEFTLGVGDTVDITVYRNEDLKLSTKINPSGRIMFPLIGEIQASGKTLSAFREDLTARLSKYVVNPQVTISVSGIQSQRILVLGEVKNPGLFSLDTELTVMDAVAKAGGWTTDAKTSNVLLLRNVSGKVDTRSIDLASVLKSGSFPHNAILQRNDVIYVPAKKIADIARFMSYIASILSPIVMAESSIVLFPQTLDALQGESSAGAINIQTR